MQMATFTFFLSYTSQAIKKKKNLQYQIFVDRNRNRVSAFVSVCVIPSTVQKAALPYGKKNENMESITMHELRVHKIKPYTQYDN